MPPRGPAIDRDYVRAFAQGARRRPASTACWSPHHSTGPDATLTVAYAARSPSASTSCSRTARASWRPRWRRASSPRSTSSAAGGSRCATSPGGSDDEQKARRRLARPRPALCAHRRISRGCCSEVWQADKPFDHEGAHYRALNAFSEGASRCRRATAARTCRCISAAPRKPRSPWPASTPTSMRCGASRSSRRASCTTRVRAGSRQARPRRALLVSYSPLILAETEERTWAARRLHPGRGLAAARGAGLQPRRLAESEGAKRYLLAAAGRGTRLDKRLWCGRAGIGGRSTAPRWWARPSRSPMRANY